MQHFSEGRFDMPQSNVLWGDLKYIMEDITISVRSG